LDESDDDEGGGFSLLPSFAGSSSSAPGGAASTGDGAVRPGIVHRLDRGTTGLVVVAKTDAAHASLAAQVGPGSAPRLSCAFRNQEHTHLLCRAASGCAS
jgi:hypothetical protein